MRHLLKLQCMLLFKRVREEGMAVIADATFMPCSLLRRISPIFITVRSCASHFPFYRKDDCIKYVIIAYFVLHVARKPLTFWLALVQVPGTIHHTLILHHTNKVVRSHHHDISFSFSFSPAFWNIERRKNK